MQFVIAALTLMLFTSSFVASFVIQSKRLTIYTKSKLFSSNIVLDKIPCVYAIEYDKKTNTPKVISDTPLFDPTQPLHVSIKLDGECCWFQAETGSPMRRRDIKNGKTPPDDWIRTGEPDKNGHTIGFIPILTDPSAKHMLQALDYKTQEAVILNQDMQTTRKMPFGELAGKTVEFMGPKVQGNPSNLSSYCFYIHGEVEVPQVDVPLASYAAMREHIANHKLTFEGYVIRLLATGQLYKITRNHLGLPWKGVTR